MKTVDDIEKTEAGAVPRVSIVVTSYNYAHVIRETLDGLAAQTWRDFEVLVVDNGSSDGSEAIIGEYVAQDPRFHLLQHPGRANKGLPGSVKLGIEKSRGEFVAFCEADDIWLPSHLEKCMALVEKSGGKANFMITDLEPFGDPQRCKEIEGAKALRRSAFSGTCNRISPAEFRQFNWIFTFSVVMARRSVLLACDIDSVPRPSNLDWWLWRQIALENDIWVVHEKLTKWRLHKQSFTVKDDNPAMIAEGYDMVAKMDRLLVARYPQAAKDIVPFLRPEDDFRCENGVLLDRNGQRTAKQPSFTIAVAAGAPDALAKTLASLAAQSYRNFEVALPAECATVPDGLPSVRRVASAASGIAAAAEAAEAGSKAEWLLPLLPGDELRDSALMAFAARAILLKDADAFFGKTLCTGTVRQLGAHTLVGGDIPCSDGLVRPFACIGAFAVRRCSRKAAGTPPAVAGDAFPERALCERLAGAKHPVFIDRIVLLYDDGAGGRDPDGADRRRFADAFVHAGLPVSKKRSFLRYAFSAVWALFRRDGLMFFVKCARYAFSPVAWKWLMARILPGSSR